MAGNEDDDGSDSLPDIAYSAEMRLIESEGSTGGSDLGPHIVDTAVIRTMANLLSMPVEEQGFDDALVTKNYLVMSEIDRSSPFARGIIDELESLGYLERYLLPHLDIREASVQHILSIAIIINNKLSKKGRAWILFEKSDLIGFLERMLCLNIKVLSPSEKVNCIDFFTNTFKDLDVTAILSKELDSLFPDENTSRFPDENTPRARNFFKDMLRDFVEVLDVKLKEPIESHWDARDNIHYVEKFAKLMVVTVTEPFTRRFFKPYLSKFCVVPKCHLCDLYTHRVGQIFRRLVDTLDLYIGFEADHPMGSEMSDDGQRHAIYLELSELSKDGSEPSHLLKELSVWSQEKLEDIVCSKLNLVALLDPWVKRSSFMVEVLVAYFRKPTSFQELVANNLSMYPTEHAMLNDNGYFGEVCSSLPKLALKYLSLYDNVYRNFNLLFHEAVYATKNDVEELLTEVLDKVSRMAPFKGNRMALPIIKFSILEVKEVESGKIKSVVTAEIEFLQSSSDDNPLSEWNDLKVNDVLYLLNIQYPSPEMRAYDDLKKDSLGALRGCQVIELCDDELGTVRNSTKGNLRTIKVALDKVQYQADMSTLEEKGPRGVKSTFNILMRLDRSYGNLFRTLKSMREVMDESYAFPDWFLNTFLGNPERQLRPILDQEIINFEDTFVDVDHVKSSFPHNDVDFVTLDGGDKYIEPCERLHIMIPSSGFSGLTSVSAEDRGSSRKQKLEVYAGLKDYPIKNAMRYTSTQIEAIWRGLHPGLTIIVGPPGTGKTAVVVQMTKLLFKNYPSSRLLLVAPSNSALANIFNRIVSQVNIPVDQQLILSEEDCTLNDIKFETKIIGADSKFIARNKGSFSFLFSYDTLLIDECAQILEIESLLPCFFRKEGGIPLKRLILLGDHNQLPPIVHNLSLVKHNDMDQSLLARLVKVGAPFVQLNYQGRTRPTIAKLYSWVYSDLKNLPKVYKDKAFTRANAGFSYEYQLIDMTEHGNSRKKRYQNDYECDYIAQVYVYMISMGYQAGQIGIITLYPQQRDLIRNAISMLKPQVPTPGMIITINESQGIECDFVLLSLVREDSIGCFRDLRRVVVAMSRARLGLYIFGSKSVMESCVEIEPTVKLLLERPVSLALNLDEKEFYTDRSLEDRGEKTFVSRDKLLEIVSRRMKIKKTKK